jgi:hypothetical protein
MSTISTLIQALGFQGLLGADVPMPPRRPPPLPPRRAEGLLSADVPMPPQRPQKLLDSNQPTVYNNPGNVERTQGWAGMLPDTGYGEKDRFAVFDSPQMGLRALMRDVTTKIENQGGDLREMIKKYAPKKENPTEKYYQYVRNKVGKNKVTMKDLPKIVQGIVEFENKPDSELSRMYLDPNVFEEALSLSKYNLPSGMTLSEARSFVSKKKK